MTTPQPAWGTPRDHALADLATLFRPIFEQIREGAADRDGNRRLPVKEIGRLKAAGFTRLRLPVIEGGFGATLPQLFELLIELGAAEPNIVNALRSHLGFVEDQLNSAPSTWRDCWRRRIAEGQTVGSGASEAAGNVVGRHSTTLLRQPDGAYLLNGEKYYTSGSLFADWINLTASGDDGKTIAALVPTKAAGVEILDDWDGFGQLLSASGTARFTNVRVEGDLIKPATSRFPYSTGFFQLVHLATLAGVARAAASDVSQLVAARRRVYGRGNAASVRDDPQILQVVGQVVGSAYAAGAIVRQASLALQRAYELMGTGDETAAKTATVEADLEVSQSVTVVTNLVLDASTKLFDALGASAVKRGVNLDRHWRNTRTLASHNPRIYHDRMVGAYAVSGVPPVGIGGVGVSGPADVVPPDARDNF